MGQGSRQNSKSLYLMISLISLVLFFAALAAGSPWLSPQRAAAIDDVMHGMNGDEYVVKSFSAEGMMPAAHAATITTKPAPGHSGKSTGAKTPAHTVRAAGDYLRDRWNPIHFKPLIDTASDQQCLACHQEIMQERPRAAAPAGNKAADSLAWYQTLDTYAGEQMSFHARHLTSPFAREVMDLKCNFCHQGNDPRDEAPGSHLENASDTSFALRKMVDPSQTCLLCHGKFPYQLMTGLEGPWHEARVNLEDPDNADARNGCLTCHKEMFRTVRHQVSYLKAENIEKLAAEGSSDVCFGCHGGRQWFRTNYPYPRHPWPGMADNVPEQPEWAKSRATESDERYRRAK